MLMRTNICFCLVPSLFSPLYYVIDNRRQKDTSPEVEQSIQDIRDNIIGLESIGVFNVFPVEDWLLDATRTGNVLVGVLALEAFPMLMNEQIKTRLNELLPLAPDTLKNEIVKIIHVKKDLK